MPKLLERWAKKTQPPRLPLPFSGLISLQVYYWLFYHWVYIMPHGWKPPYEKIIKILNTPYSGCAFTICRFKYKLDHCQCDEWLDPEETYKRMKDDCEGYAWFLLMCLKEKYDASVLCMYNEEKGHATCLIKDGNRKYRSVGTYGYMVHNCEIEDMLARWGYHDWTQYAIYDADQNEIKRVTRGD